MEEYPIHSAGQCQFFPALGKQLRFCGYDMSLSGLSISSLHSGFSRRFGGDFLGAAELARLGLGFRQPADLPRRVKSATTHPSLFSPAEKIRARSIFDVLPIPQTLAYIINGPLRQSLRPPGGFPRKPPSKG
jgi:hypothetical protein